MVKPQTGAIQELFNLFVGYSACHSERSEESRIFVFGGQSNLEMFRLAQHDKI
jgi:hypothetical protein